jgi:hypothetical protein
MRKTVGYYEDWTAFWKGLAQLRGDENIFLCWPSSAVCTKFPRKSATKVHNHCPRFGLWMYRLSSIYLSLDPLGSSVIYTVAAKTSINVLFTSLQAWYSFPGHLPCIFVEIAIVFIILTYLCSVLKVNFKVFWRFILSTPLECHPCIVTLQATWPAGRYNNSMPEFTLSPQSGIYEFGYRARYQLIHPSPLPSNPFPLCCHPSPLLTQYSPHHPILGLITEILKNPRSLRYILIRFSTQLVL